MKYFLECILWVLTELRFWLRVIKVNRVASFANVITNQLKKKLSQFLRWMNKFMESEETLHGSKYFIINQQNLIIFNFQKCIDRYQILLYRWLHFYIKHIIKRISQCTIFFISLSHAQHTKCAFSRTNILDLLALIFKWIYPLFYYFIFVYWYKLK